MQERVDLVMTRHWPLPLRSMPQQYLEPQAVPSSLFLFDKMNQPIRKVGQGLHPLPRRRAGCSAVLAQRSQLRGWRDVQVTSVSCDGGGEILRTTRTVFGPADSRHAPPCPARCRPPDASPDIYAP